MTDFFPDVDYLLDHHPSDDPVVIETIVRAYYAPILRLASSILNDFADAEDATQETFIKAAFNLDRYRTGTNFKTWLYTIAVNTCRGMLRKRKTRAHLQMLFSNISYSVSRTSFPEDHVIEFEISNDLKTAIHALDEKHRLPILLRFVHELPIAEIAQILGVRQGTIDSRLHYGIQKLKRLFKSGNQQILAQPNPNIEYPIPE